MATSGKLHKGGGKRASGEKSKGHRVRLVTLNLAGLKDGWFEGRDKVVIDGLREFRPDVLCLQEVAVRHGDGIYHQAREICQALGLKSVAFSPYGNPIEVMSPEQGGVAVISRWPMISVRNRRLPQGHDHPPDARVALLVSFETPFGELDIITTHLSWKPEETQIRLVQTGLILDTFTPSQWEGRAAKTVLLGDFNATDDEPAIQLVCERLQDAYKACHPDEEGFTWTKDNPMTAGWSHVPDRRIDYIFCPKDVRVLHSDVILDRPSGKRYASDHYGLLAELEWPAE